MVEPTVIHPVIHEAQATPELENLAEFVQQLEEVIPAVDPNSTASDTSFQELVKCVDIAGNKLQELLKETCELSLEKVAELAEEHGVKTLELLQQADKADSCFIDYSTGHVRCKEEQV